MDFGHQLRNLRLQMGMTQADLARVSNLEQAAINALELGHQEPWPSTRRALAGAFKISLEEFDARTIGASTSGAVDVMQEGATTAPAVQPPSTPTRPSWRSAPEASPALPSASGANQFGYAPAKVMELLNQLGQVEHQLRQYRSFVDQVCAACWTTDAALHLTTWFGAAAAEQRDRHGDFRGRHIAEFFASAWGEANADFLPLVMHQKAVDGTSVCFAWEVNGARFMVYVDPWRDGAGKIIGTVGVAIDLTCRESSSTA